MSRLLALVAALASAAVTIVAAAPAATAAGVYTITVHIRPASPQVGDQLTVEGTATDGSGAAAAGLTLQIVRTDRNGTQPSFVTTTGMDGTFSQPDPLPAVRGKVGYVVTYLDGSEGHASVLVHRIPTKLTIGASRAIVWSGRDVHVVATLGSPTTSRRVSIYARPYLLSRRLLRSDDVSASTGKLQATTTLHRRTRFSVRFAGDATYAPAVATVVVRARAVISERLSGGYATEGAFRIYHAGAHPVLVAHLHPQLDGVCLWFRAQRHFNGSWHTVATRCFSTDADGYARGEFTGAHLGSPYRVRARWRGSRAALSRNGAWLKLEFR
jgi:hypothetical protein